MLARVATFAIDGVQPRLVWAEVDVRAGLPAFSIVGLADAAVRESRERIRAAIQNSGFEYPQSRITANLTPASLRKVGPGFDLALALGLLAATGQLPERALAEQSVYGELSLGGELRDTAGVLAVAEGAARHAHRRLLVPLSRAREAGLVDGLRVAGARSLAEAVRILRGGAPSVAPPQPAPAQGVAQLPDLADVRDQDAAVFALEVAAAGGHNLLLEGPPGTGKTMIARRLPSILPELTRDEALEVTRIHSIAGRVGDGLIEARPFRAPHHSISAAGLVGGGSPPRPGEVTLAHRGVLFLDELSEFARPALEALRQPLEDGWVGIVRGQRAVVFPSHFVLLAATNPCPCGYAGFGERCTCGEAELRRHRRRLSGPLLDRMDLLVTVQPPRLQEIGEARGTTSEQIRARVAEARRRQQHRLQGTGARCNAELDARLLRSHLALDAAAASTINRAYASGTLSGRGRARVLRVARTLADLRGGERVGEGDVLTALGLRQRTGEETMAA